VTNQFFDRCDLHLPHKDWANDRLEAENYAAIERWALHFRTHCLPKGAPTPSPVIPDTIIANLDPFYATWGTNVWAYTLLRSQVVWNNTYAVTQFAGGAHGIVETGVSTDSRYPAAISLPVGTYRSFSLSCTFSERDYNTGNPILSTDPGGMDSVTRTLEVAIRVSSSGVLVGSWPVSVSGPRFLTTVRVDVPAQTLSAVSLVRAFATFTNIRDDHLAAPAHYGGGYFQGHTAPDTVPSVGVRIGGH
jgi:hypothetical protein